MSTNLITYQDFIDFLSPLKTKVTVNIYPNNPEKIGILDIHFSKNFPDLFYEVLKEYIDSHTSMALWKNYFRDLKWYNNILKKVKIKEIWEK